MFLICGTSRFQIFLEQSCSQMAFIWEKNMVVCKQLQWGMVASSLFHQGNGWPTRLAQVAQGPN
jgi:hypothetical protein